MLDHISRRDALRAGGVALAGVGAMALPGSALAARGPVAGVVYRLHTTERCSCLACKHHAKNKLFATRAAAAHGHAHPGCQCVVVRASAITGSQWRELFGSASELHRTSVDRRWTWVARVLRPARRGPSRHPTVSSSGRG